MFRPVALYIGLRYTRAKRRNHFISFMSLTSMLGIALGVAVLITVLSVMNGFDYEIRSRLLGMARQVTISTITGSLNNWQKLSPQVDEYPGVLGSAPFVNGQAMLSKDGVSQPVALIGILPQEESKVSTAIDEHLVNGSMDTLKASHFGIAIGENLAESLGVSIGDKITVITPTVSITPMGFFPVFKPFTVVAIFKLGNGFKFDSSLAYIHLSDAQKLFQMDKAVSGLRLKVTNLYAAPQISREIAHRLSHYFQVSNWTQEYGSFFDAIKLEKTMMFLMLLLIVAVAAFNLVSSLVMVVNEKKADIAILRTFGATPQMIMTTFIVQGSIVGIIGTLLGLIGGIILAMNATALVSGLEHLFNVQLISSDVYYVNYLPSRIEWSDVVKICIASLVMSLIATIYPAWHASRTQPAEALRYE